MILDFKGRVVGISGAACGIGRATAQLFGQEGCRLILADIDREQLSSFARELEGSGCDVVWGCTDISDKQAVSALVDRAAERFGHIDVWINNAAAMLRKPLLEFTFQEVQRILSVNLYGAIACAQCAVPYMSQPGSVIVNVCSFGGIMPAVNSAIYGASKAGLINLTRTMAAELAPRGIRVCGCLPGNIRTGMMSSRADFNEAEALKPIALHRIGEPEEIAKVLFFLASDLASYITGTSVEVSGGKLCVQNAHVRW